MGWRWPSTPAAATQGVGKTTKSIAVGAMAEITFTWTQVTAAETLTAVANQGGKILELEQTNNTFTSKEGERVHRRPRPGPP